MRRKRKRSTPYIHPFTPFSSIPVFEITTLANISKDIDILYSNYYYYYYYYYYYSPIS